MVGLLPIYLVCYDDISIDIAMVFEVERKSLILGAPLLRIS